jgi:hypothetical protein
MGKEVTQMAKKAIPACMAVAAFAAFATLTTPASAAPVVTHPTGTVLAAGTLLRGTNIRETRFTSSTLSVDCTTAVLTGSLKSNSTAGGFSAEFTSATFTGTGFEGADKKKDCTATGSFFTGSARPTPQIINGLPWCLKSSSLNDNFEIRGGACSEVPRSITFNLDLTGLVTCSYLKNNLLGTFETDISTQDATGKILEGQKWSLISGFGCPSEPTLDMEFTVETDLEVSAFPVYISS